MIIAGMKPAWIGAAIRAAYAAARECYLDACAAEQLNIRFFEGTGHPTAEHDLSDGRAFRESIFVFPHDFIVHGGKKHREEINFDPNTPPRFR